MKPTEIRTRFLLSGLESLIGISAVRLFA